MMLRRLYSEIKGKRVSEVLEQVKAMRNYTKRAIKQGMDNYDANYIQTASAAPIYHFSFGGTIFVFLLALSLQRCDRHHAHRHR